MLKKLISILFLFTLMSNNSRGGVAIDINPEDYKLFLQDIARYSISLPRSFASDALGATSLKLPSQCEWSLSDITSLSSKDIPGLLKHFQNMGISIHAFCDPSTKSHPYFSTCKMKNTFSKFVQTPDALYVSKYSEYNQSNFPEIYIDAKVTRLKLLLAYGHHVLEEKSPAYLAQYSQKALRNAFESSLVGKSTLNADEKSAVTSLQYISALGDNLELLEVFLRYKKLFSLSDDEFKNTKSGLINSLKSFKCSNCQAKIKELETLK